MPRNEARGGRIACPCHFQLRLGLVIDAIAGRNIGAGAGEAAYGQIVPAAYGGAVVIVCRGGQDAVAAVLGRVAELLAQDHFRDVDVGACDGLCVDEGDLGQLDAALDCDAQGYCYGCWGVDAEGEEERREGGGEGRRRRRVPCLNVMQCI